MSLKNPHTLQVCYVFFYDDTLLYSLWLPFLRSAFERLESETLYYSIKSAQWWLYNVLWNVMHHCFLSQKYSLWQARTAEYSIELSWHIVISNTYKWQWHLHLYLLCSYFLLFMWVHPENFWWCTCSHMLCWLKKKPLGWKQFINVLSNWKKEEPSWPSKEVGLQALSCLLEEY